jgi:hypothetical protein
VFSVESGCQSSAPGGDIQAKTQKVYCGPSLHFQKRILNNLIVNALQFHRP